MWGLPFFTANMTAGSGRKRRRTEKNVSFPVLTVRAGLPYWAMPQIFAAKILSAPRYGVVAYALLYSRLRAWRGAHL
jgi:hypothetical protein